MKKILIICNGNTVRSQMAEGILRSLSGNNFEVYSAGNKPGDEVNPDAIKVMNEIGIDISAQFPKGMDQFLNDSFDYVITVCDDTKEGCPYFPGHAKQRIHMGFESPLGINGDRETLLANFRRIRDEMMSSFQGFVDEM